MIIPPAGYWLGSRRSVAVTAFCWSATKSSCGFGRLGRWFGHQHFEVTPDIVTMAKGFVFRLRADLSDRGASSYRKCTEREE